MVLTIRGDRFDALFRSGIKTLAHKKGQPSHVAKRLAEAPRPEEAEAAEEG